MRSLVATASVVTVSASFIVGLVSCADTGTGKEGGHARLPSEGAASIAMPPVSAEAPMDYPGIHNAVSYHDGFISGSVPEGDDGFDTLRAMGVRTIISVDGSIPEVDEAESRGIRYIHLPIGYNGFDEQRRLELTRATRDALHDGPVYIHCHHGKHRSAGAAAAVAVGLGWDTPEEAVARMKVSGTSPNYVGLYSCAENATVLSVNEVDAVPPNFPSISRPSSFVQAMVDIDHAMEHLKAIEKSGWKVPADHPDLVPVAEAGRLADLLRISAEGSRARSKPADFAEGLLDGGRLAQALEGMLDAGEADAARLSAQFRLVSASCTDCHRKHRD